MSACLSVIVSFLSDGMIFMHRRIQRNRRQEVTNRLSVCHHDKWRSRWSQPIWWNFQLKFWELNRVGRLRPNFNTVRPPRRILLGLELFLQQDCSPKNPPKVSFLTKLLSHMDYEKCEKTVWGCPQKMSAFFGFLTNWQLVIVAINCLWYVIYKAGWYS